MITIKGERPIMESPNEIPANMETNNLYLKLSFPMLLIIFENKNRNKQTKSKVGISDMARIPVAKTPGIAI